MNSSIIVPVATKQAARILAAALSLPTFADDTPAQVQPDWVAPLSGATTGDAQLVYDVARRRIVMSRSDNGDVSRMDTWEWNGLSWIQRSPAHSPSARTGHAMAYDVARQRVVLFGGTSIDGSGYLADTWEWDGNDWTRRKPTKSPVSRHWHEMAYDVTRERVVLFGGQGKGSPYPTNLGDTWEWDGSNWVEHTPSIRPEPRAWHAMAYDVARRRVVLFGGSGLRSPLDDTWEWDGRKWTRRTPTTSPSPRTLHAMTYDVARQRIVLFSGGGPNGADTWEWDGKNWVEQRPSNNPGVRTSHAMAYDVARRRVVLFGGYGRRSHLDDTWEWDGRDWTRSSPGIVHPGARSGPAMAYDVARRRVVLFGAGRRGPLGETWVWDGRSWTRLSPKNSPSARTGAEMVYDVARQRVVLFGGQAAGKWLGETWEWDGSDWKKRSPTNSPSARTGHAMAYDVARQRVLLFGGGTGGSFLGDTWEWNGSDWKKLTPTSSPPPRSPVMAYDVARRRVVMFGGAHPRGYNRETWEWDGSNWTFIQRAKIPNAGFGHAMAYDVARRRVVLFGGSDWRGKLRETWEWNGKSWSQRSTAHSPDLRPGYEMVYDVAHQCIVLFGARTWLYTATPSLAEAFGTGCSSGSPPVLTSSEPYLGNPAFALELIGARPNSACVFGVSDGTQSLSIPPCTLYLRDPIVSLPAATNWAGFAESRKFAIPFAPSLRGLTFYAQAFVADGNGLASSRGRKLVVGH